MLHLPYTSMVLGFVVVGAALAPHISWVLLSGMIIAYFLGLGIGAHFLDQVPGMGSRYVHHWPTWALWLGGFASLGFAVAIGVAGALWLVGPSLLVLVFVQALCAVGYPLARWFGGLLHRDSIFAISWGCLPFLTSYLAQGGTIDLTSVLVAAVFGGVALLEIRLSRASRTLRAQARSDLTVPIAASSPLGAIRRFDRALMLLATVTVIVALTLFTGRIIVEIW